MTIDFYGRWDDNAIVLIPTVVLMNAADDEGNPADGGAIELCWLFVGVGVTFGWE